MTASAAEHSVEMRDNSFSPRNLTIQPGDTVRWDNHGNSPHSTTSNSGIWDSGVLNPGGTFSRTFDSAGDFPYFCTVHGQAMSGRITVDDGSGGGGPDRDLFLLQINGKCFTTNDTGSVVVEKLTAREIIGDCAAEHDRDPKDLVLVYDVQADAIETVDRSTGETVCTVALLGGGVTIADPTGTQKQRQTFVFWEDTEMANGSLQGIEKSTRGGSGELLKYAFRGSFMLGLQAYAEGDEIEPPKVCTASFATGKRFAP